VAVTSSTRMCTVALPPPVARQQNPSMLTPAPAVASPSLASSPGRSSKTTLKSLAIACLAFEFAPPAPEDIRAGLRNRGDIWSTPAEEGDRRTFVYHRVRQFRRACAYDRPGTTPGADEF
jgi:hypothetical protein